MGAKCSDRIALGEDLWIPCQRGPGHQGPHQGNGIKVKGWGADHSYVSIERIRITWTVQAVRPEEDINVDLSET